MARTKGAKNTFVNPAMKMAWDELTDEQRESYLDRARSNYDRSHRMSNARIATRLLTVQELESLVVAKRQEAGAK